MKLVHVLVKISCPSQRITSTQDTACTEQHKGFSPLFIRIHNADSVLILWLRRLMLARVHLAAILVERPESVPEQTRWVVPLLERDEALPVLAEGGGHACGELVSSKELRIAPLYMRIPSFTRERELTEGKAPPHATGLIVSRSHCFIGEGKENNMRRGQRRHARGEEYFLTSSALETQRGSSVP